MPITLNLANRQMRPWRLYEDQIRERLKQSAGQTATVAFNQVLAGRLSKVKRQVDILVKGAYAGNTLDGVTMAVDCKCWARNITVGDVDRFAGFVADVGTDLGLLITTEGFSAGARARAENARGLKVDLVTYEDLADWRPPLVDCPVCIEPDSDRFPGMAWIESLYDAPGCELVSGVGTCEVCSSHIWLCQCRTPNGVYEHQHGEWVECEGGCGVEALYRAELDRKGMVVGESWAFRHQSPQPVL